MVRFNMARIAVSQFAILSDDMPQGEINLSTEISFQYSQESRMIACEVGYKFTSEEAPFMVLKMQCEFKIHEEDWDKFVSGEDVLIPKDVLELLAVHTIGTSRGVLFCKTEGTPFNRLMIPPINVARMMAEEDAVVKSR